MPGGLFFQMKIEVRYYSKGGNTSKLAQAVGEAVGTVAKTTADDLTEKCDLLLLGASVYAGRADKEVLDFIRRNAREIGAIAVFGSSASGRSTFSSVQAVAEDAGVKVLLSDFSCYGKFMFLHKNHPDEKDLSRAAAFAKARVEELEANT